MSGTTAQTTGETGAQRAHPHVRTHNHHIAAVTHRTLAQRRDLVHEVNGFNARTAVLVTGVLGSMPFFWFSNLLALVSLPAVLTLVDHSLKSAFPHWLINAALISLVAWVAQTYIQLVALPVLQVSGNAQANAQAENTRMLLKETEETHARTAKLLDAMDLTTEGGLTAVLAAVDALRAELVAQQGTKSQ